MNESYYDSLVRLKDGIGLNDQTIDTLNSNLGGVTTGSPVDRILGSYENVDASRRIQSDIYDQSRSWGTVAKDAAVGIPLTVGQELAGVGSLGARMLGADGTAQALAELSQGIGNTQDRLKSDNVQNQQRYLQSRRQAQTEDNDAQFARDIANGKSQTSATLGSVGRGVMNAFSNIVAAPVASGSEVVDQVGSLAAGFGAGSLAAKGLSKVGAKAAANKAASLGAEQGSKYLAKREFLQRAAGAFGYNLASEEGSIFADTFNEAMGMDINELAQTSPRFVELVQSGKAPEEAHTQLAMEAADTAVKTSLPAVTAGAALSAPFTADPLKGIRSGLAQNTFMQGLGTAGKLVGSDIVREGASELAISGAGQAGKNIGIAESLDNARQWYEGVGDAAGQGAVTSMALTGGVKSVGAPKQAYNVAKAGGSAALKKADEKLQERADRKSPTSEAKVREQATAFTQDVQAKAAQAQEDITNTPEPTEEQVVRSDAYNKAYASMYPSIEEREAVSTQFLEAGVSEDLANKVRDSETSQDFLMNMAATLNDSKAAPTDRAIAAQAMNYTINSLDQTTDEFVSLIEKGELDEDLKNTFLEYAQLTENLSKIPTVAKAIKEIHQVAEQTVIEPVTDSNITQQKANEIALVADKAPSNTSLRPEDIDMVLKHTVAGDVQLAPKQVTSLKALRSALQASVDSTRTLDDSRINGKLKDRVSAQIKSNKPDRDLGVPIRHDSAESHYNKILGSIQSGEVDIAIEQMKELGNFTQHQINKLGALNQSLEDGNRHSFQAYNPTKGEWYDYVESAKKSKSKSNSKDGYGVTRGNPNSEALALHIASDTEYLGNLYNNLIEAFPDELGSLEAISVPELNLDSMFDAQVAEQLNTDTVPSDVVEQQEAIQQELDLEEQVSDSLAQEEVPTDITEAQTAINRELSDDEMASVNEQIANALSDDSVQEDVAIQAREIEESITDTVAEPTTENVSETKPKKKVSEPKEQVKVAPTRETSLEDKAIETYMGDTSREGISRTDVDAGVSMAIDDLVNGRNLEEAIQYLEMNEIDNPIELYRAAQQKIFDKNKKHKEATKTLKAQESQLTKADNGISKLVNNITELQKSKGNQSKVKSQIKTLNKARASREVLLGQIEDTKQEIINTAPIIRDSYPNLVDNIGGKENLFTKHFRKRSLLNRAPIQDMPNPIDAITAALNNPDTALAGLVLQGIYEGMPPAVIKSYMDSVTKRTLVAQEIVDNVQEYVENVSAEYRFRNNDDWNTDLLGKSNSLIAHISEEVTAENGTKHLQINKQLLELAALSMADVLGSDTLNKNRINADYIAKQYKGKQLIQGDESILDVLDAINDGYNLESIVSAVARNIDSFWGLDRDSNVPFAMSKLSETLATDMVNAVVLQTTVPTVNGKRTFYKSKKGNHILTIKDTKTLELGEMVEGKLVKTPRPYHIYDITDKNLTSENEMFKEPLSGLFGSEGNTQYSIGSPVDGRKVSDTRAKTGGTKLTEEQQVAQKAMNETPNYINKTGFTDLIMDMTADSNLVDKFVNLFGGRVPTDMTNINTALTLKGKRDGVMRSLNVTKNYVNSITEYAKANDMDVSEAAMYFNYKMTSEGRYHVEGGNAPTTDTFIREMISPTKSTLDLTDPDMLSNYFLSLAQGMGVGVEKVSPEQIGKDLRDKLSKAEPIIREFMKDTPDTNKVIDLAQTIIAKPNGNYVDGADFRQLHNIYEYARFQKAKKEGTLNNHTTHIYLESDGVTNGPIHAMMLYGNILSPDLINTVAKGGVFLNEDTLGMSINDYKGIDNIDVYGTSAIKTEANFENKRLEETSNINPEAYRDIHKAVYSSLGNLHNTYMDGFSFVQNSDGSLDVSIDRGGVKNPLTITVYGSGAAGIAGDITNALMEAVYNDIETIIENDDIEKLHKLTRDLGILTGVRTNISNGGDAYTGSLKSVARQSISSRFFTGLNTNVNNLTDETFRKNLLSKMYVANNVNVGEVADPRFTLSTGEFSTMQSNIQKLLVGPMVQAIEDTVGSDVIKASDAFAGITEAMSLHQIAEFDKRIQLITEDAIAKVQERTGKKTRDTSRATFEFTEGDINKQLKEVMDEFLPLFAGNTIITPQVIQNQVIDSFNAKIVASGEMTAGISKKDTDVLTKMVADLSIELMAPYTSGVGGSAKAVIATGDGSTTTATMNDPQISEMENLGTWIHDGWNNTPQDMNIASVIANRGVHGVFATDRLTESLKSFADGYSRIVKTVTDMSEEEFIVLRNKMLAWEVKPKEGTDLRDEYLENLDNSLHNFTLAAIRDSAKAATLNNTKMTVDQMASARVPYNHEGELTYGTKEFLQAYADNVAEAISSLKELNNPVLTEFVSQVESTIQDEIDNYVISNTSVPKTDITTDPVGWIKANVSKGKLSKRVEGTINSLIKAGSLDGITVQVLPTAERVSVGESKDMGSYNPNTKVLTLYEDSEAITAGHEIIHTATFEGILNILDGKSDVAIGAVNNTVTIATNLTNKWKGSKKLNRSQASFRLSYNNIAGDTLPADFTREQRAKIAAEMVAYGLTEPALERELKGMKASTEYKGLIGSIKRILRAVFGVNANAVTTAYGELNQYARLFSYQRAKSDTGSRSTEVLSGLTLNHTVADDANTLLEQKLVANIAKAEALIAELGVLPERVTARNRATITSLESNARVRDAFDLTPNGSTLFNVIAQALETERAFNPNATKEASRIFGEYLRKVTPKHFEDAGFSKADAQVKFEALTVPTEGGTKSTLLTSFIGLATVDSGFREVLSNIKMPSKVANNKNIDTRLEAFGSNAMNRLGEMLTGNMKRPNDLLAAMDNIIQSAVDSPVDNNQDNAVSRLSDKANKFAVDAIDNTLDKLNDFGDKLNKHDKSFAGNVLKSVSVLGSSKLAGENSDALVHALNQAPLVPKFVTKAIFDVVGSTTNNKGMYALIKEVKNYVQRMRQNYREKIPAELRAQFSEGLSPKVSTALTNTILKGDLTVLNHTVGMDVLSTDKKVASAISKLESKLTDKFHIDEAKKLAKFMVTGDVETTILRNAEQIARKFGTNNPVAATDTLVQDIDTLTSLYAFELMDSDDKATLRDMYKTEPEGMKTLVNYITGQKEIEASRNPDGYSLGKLNAPKGYVPYDNSSGKLIRLAPLSDKQSLIQDSYEFLGEFDSTGLPKEYRNQGYFYLPVRGTSGFSQGVSQNIRDTYNGLDAANGYSSDPVLGRITDTATVRALHKRGVSGLVPIYGNSGRTPIAFEIPLTAEHKQKIDSNTDIAELVGNWRGRQEEEAISGAFNSVLVDEMVKMSKLEQSEMSPDSFKKSYVDILDNDVLKNDPVLEDALNLLPPEIKQELKDKAVKGKFYVRKDMIEDAFGYRDPSITDFYNGITRHSERTQRVVKNLTREVFGNNGYKYLVQGEDVLKGAVQYAKTNIIVRSGIVPVVNFASNMVQLVGMGVPLSSLKKLPSKLSEINSYIENEDKIIKLEVALQSEVDGSRKDKLQARIESLHDANTKLSIWPLIEAGEFTSISDATSREGGLDYLRKGKLDEYLEVAVNKTPASLRSVGKTLFATKDSALFKALQRANDYGDFLAKAILYDDLTLRKKTGLEETMDIVRDAFVNYDRLAGRDRQLLENVGLLWFYNWKLRASKTAISMVRNNPFHVLLSSLIPMPDLLKTVGTPVEDSLIGKAVNGGSMTYTMGPQMGFNSVGHLPINHIVNVVN